MSKFLKIFLLFYNFIFILFVVSNIFDPDFGWHLRFGKEWFESGSFPYLETYTYTHFGQLWINHEWGGDLLYWLIYKNFGYYALTFITPLVILSAFFVTQKIYGKYGLTAVLVTTFLIWANQQIMTTRLTMLSLLFFALIWYSVKNIEEKKTYYFWPIFFWIWAFLHGSFTLGFIVIGIYFCGNLLNTFFLHYYPKFSLGKSWTKQTYLKVVLWGGLSALIILLNPYGLNLYKEVLSYFSYDFYKGHITEWLNMATFPVYWRSALFVAPASIAFFWNIKKKLFSWPELILFCCLFYIALKYKRQVIFLALFCQPFFTTFLQKAEEDIDFALKKIKKLYIARTIRYAFFSFIFITFLLITTNYLFDIKIYKDVWPNIKYMNNYFPVDAITFLQKKINPTSHVRIFNNFNWGGYMNWTLPQALLFLDGRGAGTWKTHGSTITSLETYYALMDQQNGLQELEKQKVQYVVLEDLTNFTLEIDFVNRWLFPMIDLKKNISTTPRQLEKSLRQSQNWQIIYNDGKVNIWEFISTTPLETK